MKNVDNHKKNIKILSLLITLFIFCFPYNAFALDTEYITLGKYEQDDDTSNGKEDIEWQVLDKTEDRMLVISRYILDTKPFNATYGYITWANSTLRKFCNNTFYEQSFTPAEKKRIVEVTNKNPANAKFNISGGSDSKDKVFVLSHDEARTYFGPESPEFVNTNAIAIGTPYAKGKKLFVNYQENAWYNGFSPYWLRSPGSYLTSAMYVTEIGEVLMWGDSVTFYYGVRPAMWITLE